MYQPVLFRDRPLHLQILLGGLIPALLGAVAGILVGISAVAYWALAGVIALLSILAGYEHRDGWGGADRGFFCGLIYGIALLLAHAAAGTHARVSLGKFPPMLAVVTALVGMLLSAIGGYHARQARLRAARESGELVEEGLI